MKKVAIYTKKRDAETLVYLNGFIDKLKEKNIESVLHLAMKEEMDFTKEMAVFSDKKDLIENKIDAFFTFGGDGTIVSSLIYVHDSNIPIIGVNTGRLGFLSSFTKEGVFEELDDIVEGKTKISERSVIEVVSPKTKTFFPFALNDITISRKETTSMITVESHIDDEFLNFFWGDGVIISTPTGSTAYSLSCGGPIITPNNNNFSITPIAPHNLNVRPLIVNDEVKLRLKVESRASQYTLSLDSRLMHVNTDVEIVLKKANFSVHLVQPKDLSFYETIRQKLLWGKDKRN